MPEIKPDLSDQSRCISVHWSLPVQCVLPCTHRENWHEAWHPGTGNRIRYRRSFGTYRTEELTDGWNDLGIPPPGEVCGEPHSSTLGVFCQAPRTHNERTWTHHAVVNGCRYTWNTIRRESTPDQVAKDLRRVREIAADAEADRDRARDAAVALEQENARARAIHEPEQYSDDLWPHCLECTKDNADVVPWPCPTVRALDGGEGSC